MQLDLVAQELQGKIRGQIKVKELLKHHTTWKIGGPADLLVTPADQEEINLIINFTREKGLPITVLGNGSNVLVSDGGIRGLVLKLVGGPAKVVIDRERITAEAGALMPYLAREAYHHSLTGLEFMTGIPGSVGGAAVMNAGANGHCMDQVVKNLEVIELDGKHQAIPVEKLGFGYRASTLKKQQVIVLTVHFQLQQGNQTEIKLKMDRSLQFRKEKQPLSWPSAGSVFVNPQGNAAGYLIEAAGVKGLRRGDAQVSEKHANFIINLGNATAKDVLLLIEEVKDHVFRYFGVELQTEIQFLGEEP